MQDSITMAEVGSIVNVSGSRIATPLGPPRPGSTPTKMPSTSPSIINSSVFQVSSTAKPCIKRPKASITGLPLQGFHQSIPSISSLRGAKRRSNPYFRCGTMDCFASLAMTEGVMPNPLAAERRFERALWHVDVEGDMQGHEHHGG